MKVSRVLLGLLVCTSLVCGPAQGAGVPSPTPKPTPTAVPAPQPISAEALRPFYVEYLEVQVMKDNLDKQQTELNKKAADADARFKVLCEAAKVNPNDYVFDLKAGTMTKRPSLTPTATKK